MPLVSETAQSGSQLEAAIAAGVRQISREQTLTFTQYQRTVLPLDGYLFWIKTAASPFSVKGSLHYGVDIHQVEDETIAMNRVMFTCETEVQEFNAIAPNVLWIASLGDQSASNAPQAPGLSKFESSPVLFAFSSRDLYFRKANVFHYVGVAVQPPLLSQLVDNASQLPDQPIVGNSLPIWLSLTEYGPVYPSFLVPQNVEPPYVVAHIPPESTEALQAFSIPTFNSATLPRLASNQLLRDSVRLTLYGFSNSVAIQYLNYLCDYSLNTDAFGVMNMPVIRDEKRVQADITAIAMKKTVEIETSYYQATAFAVARELILSATLAVTIGAL